VAAIRKTSRSSSSGRRLNTGIGMNFRGFRSVSTNIPFNAPLFKSCSQAHEDGDVRFFFGGFGMST